jgi:hypothetical protein
LSAGFGSNVVVGKKTTMKTTVMKASIAPNVAIRGVISILLRG